MLFPSPVSAAAPHRVVVTGAGIVTALGIGWRANADGFRAGRTAFRRVTLFDVSRQRVKQAAEVDLPATLPPNRLPPKVLPRLDRATRLLLWAGVEAVAQAGWGGGGAMAVVLGTTSGGMGRGQDYYRQATNRPHSFRGQPTRLVHYQSQQQGIDLCNALGFEGSLTVVSNACASGANAIGLAWEWVRSGRVPRALACGGDAVCQLTFAGFDALQALSPTTCRPFDARRDGLSLGEGAAVLAIETLEAARRRGAEIVGEIIGYAAATDVHHLTQPHPQGDAAFATMHAACGAARIDPAGVGYVNAHGTGTPLNDASEALAVNRWAGAHATRLPVSSTKASIGHLLGGAGAVEAVVCLMALRGQWLPPELGVEAVDQVCAFPLVRAPRDERFEVALSNSFGFGGANATLAFRRFA